MLEPPFNAEMFVCAREAAGLSQGDLAQALNVTQGTISKIETKQLPPTREMLERAAEVLDCRPSYFHRWPKHRSLPITFYRKKVKMPAMTLKCIHANVIRTRVELEILLRSANMPENRVPAINLDARGITPAQAAKEVRLRWNLPPGPIENLTEVVEGAGVLVIPQDFKTDMMSGLGTFEPGDELPPVVFINRDCPPDRARFTLAHEIGHIVLHHHLPLPPEDCEVEADEFAAEFLMPATDIRGFLGRLMTLQDAAALKQTWKTSMAALITRAADLERITPGRYRSLNIEMARLGWKKQEPVELEPEIPSLHIELAQAHVEELGYDQVQLSQALDMPEERLRTQYLGLRPRLRLVR